MKVLYLHQYFISPGMAGGTRSFEMARRLVQHGHDVTVITSRTSALQKDDALWEQSSEHGIDIHWTTIPYSNNMSYRERMGAFFAFASRASKRAMSIKPDVVFATSTPLTIALPGIAASRRHRVPMVFEVRDLWPELPIAMGALNSSIAQRSARMLELLAYKSSTHIVALSPGMKEGITARGIDESRVSVIPNSCDIALFQSDASNGAAFRKEQSWLGNRPMVLYPGTIGHINDVQFLVRTAAEMAKIDPNVCFLVMGDGVNEARVRELALDLGILNTNFFLLAPRPKAEMPGVLAAATITTSLFIDVPAMQSNSANKFFDGLAAGRPVAINYEGWQADLLRNSGAGLVLDRNPDDAARQLSVSLGDQRWLDNASQQALTLAERHFDRDDLANQLESVLVSAANGHGMQLTPI